MKAKRWISLLLAVSMMLGVLAMPASAAAQQPESTAVVSEALPDAAELSAAEDENDIVSIRIKATGNLVYGSDYKLEVETRPENTQYIAVVLGTSGEAYGYVTLMISDKLRTLLKLILYDKHPVFFVIVPLIYLNCGFHTLCSHFLPVIIECYKL